MDPSSLADALQQGAGESFDSDLSLVHASTGKLRPEALGMMGPEFHEEFEVPAFLYASFGKSFRPSVADVIEKLDGKVPHVSRRATVRSNTWFAASFLKPCH